MGRSAARGALGLAGLLGAASAGAQWATVQNARLDETRFFDGDSFTLSAGQNVRRYRLYFVDAPETDATLPDRVREQAGYWRITPERVRQLGEEARRFTREFLAGGAAVHHRHEEAGGRGERSFGWVEVNGRGLDEALVEAGLARIYGKGTDLPDGTPEDRHWTRLRAAERRARKARVGGWADPLRPAEDSPPAAPMRSPAGAVDAAVSSKSGKVSPP